MRKMLLGALAGALIILGGCSSQEPIPLSVAYDMAISVGDEVNPYAGNKSHPIVLRLFQLSESGRFKKAEFMTLFKDDVQVLGSALIDIHSLDPLLPGEERMLKLDIHRQSQYLAVLAEFADYANAKSTAIIKLPDDNEIPLIIRVSGLSVSLSQATDD